jgi:hypothetical protein
MALASAADYLAIRCLNPVVCQNNFSELQILTMALLVIAVQYTRAQNTRAQKLEMKGFKENTIWISR